MTSIMRNRTAINSRSKGAGAFDFAALIAETNGLMRSLGMDTDEMRRHLLSAYGRRSRQLLTDPELIEFRDYLQRRVASADVPRFPIPDRPMTALSFSSILWRMWIDAFK